MSMGSDRACAKSGTPGLGVTPLRGVYKHELRPCCFRLYLTRADPSICILWNTLLSGGLFVDNGESSQNISHDGQNKRVSFTLPLGHEHGIRSTDMYARDLIQNVNRS